MIPRQNTPAVIFDLGKVLLDFNYALAVKNFLAHCQKPFLEVLALLDQSTLLLRFEKDEISTEEFFREIKSAAGFAGELSEFCASFADIFRPIQPMIDWQAALRARGFPTYIFSNTNRLAIGHIRKQYPFFHNFDGYILSCEHRALKPNSALYEVVEKITGRSGPDLVYIDDRAENVEAGAARGWQAFVHHQPHRTIALVEKCLERS